MAAQHGYSTAVHYDADGNFAAGAVEVTGVISIEGGDRTVTKVNTTHLKSTGAVKTAVPGFIDDGTLSITCDYDETVYAALEVIFLARTLEYWRITYADSSTLIGEGYISNLSKPTVPEDDRLTYTIEVFPASDWDLTAN